MKTVVYIEINCPIHEEVRMALAEFPPKELVVCPIGNCGRIRVWTLLGDGRTTLALPFFEQLKECRNWNREVPSEDPETIRKRVVRKQYQHQERQSAL